MVNRNVMKAKLTTEKEPRDFLGHITYTYSEEVYNLLFYKNITKTRDVVFNPHGKYLCTKKLELPLRQRLINNGYKIEQMTVTTKTNRSVPAITIECNNTKCMYYSEKRKEGCRIIVKAEVEIYRKKGSKEDEKDILLTFPTRTMDETTKKTKCLLKYVFFKTGFIGSPDTYSKINRC